MKTTWSATIALMAILISFVFADLPGQNSKTVKEAISLGLPLVKKAAKNWQSNRSCFSCHHQTLPMLAMLEANRLGFTPDQEWLESQADTTHTYFSERIDDMLAGRHVPGGAATTGYGLWALSLAGRPSDEVTSAMVTYLLQIQGTQKIAKENPRPKPSIQDGRWVASCRRAPIQASDIGDTILVLVGMEKYASDSQREDVEKARSRAELWLSQVKLKHHQDRLWRLWGLYELDPGSPQVAFVRNQILNMQRKDGGWSESDERSSDAYSTGQTLYLLSKYGIPNETSALQRARDYLLKTQLEDGSWLVESHVKNKVQSYFENGDPHGEHQFLSTAGAAWAIAGLSQCGDDVGSSQPP
jgi:Prenyltransferase and squalene oxidase repeat